MTCASQKVFWSEFYRERNVESPYWPFWVENESQVLYGGSTNNILLLRTRSSDPRCVWWIADLPLSFVADTVIAPFVVVEILRRRGSDSPSGLEDRQ